ncbi:hypothetical protein CL6EHI_087700 [Entamoeba histolytica]|uniref:Uncharacterized protein n=1 Tax=Entamoeba histolytica TaxID=5759 RepID=A0A175JIT6_ENTHI|nr:hypothetical protein CL6EHI_087700 [Entamoeba histolytica]
MGKVFLERQTCVMNEKVGKNEVYVVVKQTNFMLCLTSVEPIENAEVTCELLYDIPELKPVPYVSQKPISYKVQQVSNEAINIECKLNVLSSKHEDMLFKIRANVYNNGVVVGEVISYPIRCTSKIDGTKKSRQIINKSLVHQQIEATKPKKNDLPIPNSATQRKVFELALLSSNTILLERLSSLTRREETKITTIEAGIQAICEKMAGIEYSTLQVHLMNVLGGLDIEQSNTLFEICSVIQSMFPQQYTFQPIITQNSQQLPQQYTPFGEFNGNYSGQPNVFGTL